MTLPPVPPEVWADEGRRTAGHFADIAAAVVVGRDAEAAAQVALGIARAAAQGQRRVAVADLIGGVPALTPLDAQDGLLECLRDGLAVSDIGQPLADAPDVYVLPSGNGPIAERWVFESARWERLVAGFREVDALLLLVAQAGTPGLETLIARVDGVVAVDLPPAVVRAWPLIATVDHPEPELPPIPRTPTPASQAAVPAPTATGQRPRRKLGRWVLLGGLVAGAALWLGLQPPAMGCDGRPITREMVAVPACRPEQMAAADSMRQEEARRAAEARAAGAAADTAPASDSTGGSFFVLGDIVNPGDSAAARRWSVELVAANSLAGANSTLTPRGDPYPLPTVAPVVLGTAPTVWYRAMVGAWATQQEAEVWLGRQRQLGLLRANVGRVVHTPFALQLFEGPREEALLETAKLSGEDVLAYVLETEDGRVRVLVGAFETANQAYWFASQLWERGQYPRLAYRTGRTF